MRKKIVLAVTGLTPQVITESVYALAVESNPPFVPDEVHAITTVEGAERIQLTLIEGERQLQRLMSDYGLEDANIRLDVETIHVITDANGAPLRDIRTPDNNQAAADLITDIVRHLTADADSTVHASIAGGRKTMGFYLGYALSLFGRPQDRLSHVLVSEPFESHYEFFFPPRTPRVLFTRDNKPISTRDARITLADIPFVRLREGLPESLRDGKTRYSEAVLAVQRSLDEAPELTIDLAGQCLHACGLTIKMPPALLAYYAWMARRCKNALPAVPIPVENEQNPDYRNGVIEELLHIKGMGEADSRTADALNEGMEKAYFEQAKSRVNRRLRDSLGGYAAKPYLIVGSGTRPQCFGLTLAPEQIVFKGSGSTIGAAPERKNRTRNDEA